MTVPGPGKQISSRKAGLLALVSLAAGVAGGWSIHHVQRDSSPIATRESAVSTYSASTGHATDPVSAKQLADTQAAPLLEKLKSDPSNAELLANAGNIYYDAQQYPQAVDYYARSLKAAPSNVPVRTDMATAYWYMGDADAAIAEYNKALSYEPENPNTLFNLGLVRWKGKRDGAGALGDWNKLLAANPQYDGKDKVSQMIAEVKHTQHE